MGCVAKVPRRRVSLCEALNRVIDTGVVVMGELVISVADVDLLYLDLNLLLSSVETLLDAADKYKLKPEETGALAPRLSVRALPEHSLESAIIGAEGSDL